MRLGHDEQPYYRPRPDGDDSVTWRSRMLFLECARHLEPDIIRSLRKHAMAVYGRAVDSPLIHDSWLMEWATVAGARTGFRPQLIPLKRAILTWANKYQLQSSRLDLDLKDPRTYERRHLQEDWLLRTALNSIRFWHASRWKTSRGKRLLWYNWTPPLPAQRFLFSPEEAKWPPWKLKRLVKEKELEMASALRPSLRISKVPEKRIRYANNPLLHYEWLAIYHIKHWSYRRITDCFSSAAPRAQDRRELSRLLRRADYPPTSDYTFDAKVVADAVRKTAVDIELTHRLRFSPYPLP